MVQQSRQQGQHRRRLDLSIFILLEELYHSGRLQAGEKILCHVPESGRALNGFMLLEVM
jgi:3-oxoacyl-[acyl-carrier-protein] synthase III